MYNSQKENLNLFQSIYQAIKTIMVCHKRPPKFKISLIGRSSQIVATSRFFFMLKGKRLFLPKKYSFLYFYCSFLYHFLVIFYKYIYFFMIIIIDQLLLLQLNMNILLGSRRYFCIFHLQRFLR